MLGTSHQVLATSPRKTSVRRETRVSGGKDIKRRGNGGVTEEVGV